MNFDYLSDLNQATTDNLSELAQKIMELQAVRREIETIKQHLKTLEKTENTMSSEEIPDYLLKIGMSSIVLENGSSITIKEDIYCSLPKEDPIKRKKVLDWISQHGGGGMIKDNVTIQDPDEEILRHIQSYGMSYERKQDIHSSTLKAFFRDLLGLKKNSIAKVELVDIPAEANVFLKKETVIK